MKATKFCKQNCFFLSFVCPADDQHINVYYYVQKAHQGSTWQTESVSQRAGCRQLNE